MRRKYCLITLLMTIMLCMSGCGDEATEVSDELTQESATEEVAVEIEKVETQDIAEPTVEAKSRKPIKVAIAGTQAKDILGRADIVLESTDFCIEIIECEDYKKPAQMVVAGEADACLSMNQVYLDSYNKINDSDLVIKERLFLDPLAIFPGTITDMNYIPSNFSVAVQEGDVNVARALYLLEQKGLIEVDDSAMYQATMSDVTSNPYNISIEEVNVENGWPDVSKYGLIISDYNRALIDRIDPMSSLGEENRNSEIVDLFAVSLVVKQENLEDDKIGKLLKAINSDEVEEYISSSFYRSVLDYK